MKYFICMLSAVWFFNIARGSGEASVGFDEVTLASRRNHIEIKILQREEGGVDVLIGLDKKSMTIDPKYLFGAKNVAMESIRLIAAPSSPGEIPEGKLIEHGFVVSFAFGGTEEHGSDSVEGRVLVFKVVRLYFNASGFVESELAVPQGEYKNKWDIYNMERGAPKEIKTIEISSVKCPWTASIE